MRRFLHHLVDFDWLEIIGLGGLVLLAVGLWKLDNAIALTVVGALIFLISVLAIRNRKPRRR